MKRLGRVYYMMLCAGGHVIAVSREGQICSSNDSKQSVMMIQELWVSHSDIGRTASINDYDLRPSQYSALHSETWGSKQQPRFLWARSHQMAWSTQGQVLSMLIRGDNKKLTRLILILLRYRELAAWLFPSTTLMSFWRIERRRLAAELVCDGLQWGVCPLQHRRPTELRTACLISLHQLHRLLKHPWNQDRQRE